MPGESLEDQASERPLSVVGPTVCDMAEKRSPHLRVVDPGRATGPAPQEARADYWAQVQALRDERQRLRAG